MNKIIIDTDKYDLDIKEDLLIEIKKDTIININSEDNNNIIIYSNNNKVKIIINLFDNSNLIINSLGINSSIDYNVNLNNNNYLLVVDSILSKIDSLNNINIISNGNDSKVYFYTNGINLSNNKLYFNLDGIVTKESHNAYLEENSKIININDGDSKIVPNLIIDSKDVVANHSAFIGTFTKKDLYYLMSRGISLKDAKKLLIKSILLNKMELNKDLFIKEIFLNIK